MIHPVAVRTTLEHLAQPRGERLRLARLAVLVAEEPAVVAGEDGELLVELVGERGGGAPGERARALDAGGDDHARRRGGERGDVRLVGRDRVGDAGQQRVGAGPVVAGRQAEGGRVGQLGAELVGELALPGRQRDERRHPGSPPALVVRVLHLLLRGERLLRIRQHAQQGRLVRDERADVVGVRGDEVQPGDRAPAAAEEVDRPAELGDQPVQVVGLLLGGVRGLAVAAGAPAEAARVVRDHGPVREVRRERAEAGRVHGLAR